MTNAVGHGIRELRSRVNKEVLLALGKSPSLAGHIKRDCGCTTCEVNRAIRRAFRRKRQPLHPDEVECA